jgi:hypothetical protein
MFAPQTKRYSWVKGPGAIGVGARQVTPIPIDSQYRMDTTVLRQKLEQALQERRPVIAVVGVVGTTEEGAVDPMHELVTLRTEFARRGLTFSLHCDAAYGGYIAACFRSAGGEFRSLNEMQREYAGWPIEEVYKSYAAMDEPLHPGAGAEQNDLPRSLFRDLANVAARGTTGAVQLAPGT